MGIYRLGTYNCHGQCCFKKKKKKRITPSVPEVPSQGPCGSRGMPLFFKGKISGQIRTTYYIGFLHFNLLYPNRPCSLPPGRRCSSSSAGIVVTCDESTTPPRVGATVLLGWVKDHEFTGAERDSRSTVGEDKTLCRLVKMTSFH